MWKLYISYNASASLCRGSTQSFIHLLIICLAVKAKYIPYGWPYFMLFQAGTFRCGVFSSTILLMIHMRLFSYYIWVLHEHANKH